jgi:CRP/FNR family transcriptional regulator, cyclic AMP receptor protein
LKTSRCFNRRDRVRQNFSVVSLPVERLGSVPLFEGLDAAELESIADLMNEANVPVGGIVTAEGGPGDGFFVIESGEAEVTIEGEPRARMTTGDYFGEIALLLGSSRTATVTAITPLRCYALTPWDFRELVEANPTIAWKVMQSMAARLG